MGSFPVSMPHFRSRYLKFQLTITHRHLIYRQVVYKLYYMPKWAYNMLNETAGVVRPLATLVLTVPMSLTACVLAGWMFHITVEQRFLNAPQPQAGDKDQEEKVSGAVSP